MQKNIWKTTFFGNTVYTTSSSFIFLNNQVDFRWDNVTIYDKKGSQKVSAGPFCGNTVPDGYTTSGNYAGVMFTSDGFVDGPGFEIIYACIKPCKDKKKTKKCEKLKKKKKCGKKNVWKKCKKTCGRC